MPKVSARRTKRRTPLSPARITDAAVALADRDGIEAVTMRSVALKLRVEAMSLYNHVANKEALLDAMVERVVGDFEWPATDGDWKGELRRRALSAHQVLLTHPWASLLILSRVNIGPAMLGHVDATIGCLRGAGFSWAMTDHAWNAIDNHVHGFTLQKLNFPFESAEYAAVASEYLPMVPAETYPHLNGMTREVAAARHDGVQDFEFGLSLILDGLERQLPRGGRKRT